MSFKTTDYLLFAPRKTELDNELLSEFNPFLTIKTISFYENGQLVDYINDTLNIYGVVFDNAEDKFKFFENIIPRQPKRRINYIKRPQPPTDKKDIPPTPEFCSKREIDMLDQMRKYLHERTTASVH